MSDLERHKHAIRLSRDGMMVGVAGRS